MVRKRVLQGYGMTDSNQAWIPDLDDHFGDKSKIAENATIFSISLLGEEIYRMYWIIPCDVTTNRARVYKLRQPKGGDGFGVSSAVRAGKPVS
ncbi:hypothetical protein AVEN_118762-1 [Araneus ventricosus]|uniref:Uncharacterized protein n=1 Tax=Araneus ventricosus TaxID=182803 RepID=A0A4Y2BVD6_ARAVE|nr:hypothetical protein AVEN_118762-1 [Araneus ventricosus]